VAILRINILHTVLEIVGSPEICKVLANEFECLFLPKGSCAVPSFQARGIVKSHNSLLSDIPKWVVDDLNFELLDGDKKHTEHHVSENRLFVYTRAEDGSVGIFCSDDLINFRLTVYRNKSPKGLLRICSVFMPMLLRIIGESCGYLLFHCAAIMDLSGRVAVFLAHAGTGKTTISLALIERGYKLLNDDLAYIGGERGNEVCGILEKVNCTNWTKTYFPKCIQHLKHTNADPLYKKQSFDVREVYGDDVVGKQGFAKLIFILKKDHESPLHLKKASVSTFLSNIRDSQIFPLSMHGGKIVLDLLSHVKTYELYTGSDPLKTAEWIDYNWNELIQPVQNEGVSFRDTKHEP